MRRKTRRHRRVFSIGPPEPEDIGNAIYIGTRKTVRYEQYNRSAKIAVVITVGYCFTIYDAK